MKEPILYAGQLMDRGAQSNIKTNSQPRDISHCHDIFSRKREADVYYKSFLMRYLFLWLSNIKRFHPVSSTFQTREVVVFPCIIHVFKLNKIEENF